MKKKAKAFNRREVEVESIDRSGEIEIYDYGTGKHRTFEMEER
jgi:hypothetical protein